LDAYVPRGRKSSRAFSRQNSPGESPALPPPAVQGVKREENPNRLNLLSRVPVNEGGASSPVLMNTDDEDLEEIEGGSSSPVPMNIDDEDLAEIGEDAEEIHEARGKRYKENDKRQEGSAVQPMSRFRKKTIERREESERARGRPGPAAHGYGTRHRDDRRGQPPLFDEKPFGEKGRKKKWAPVATDREGDEIRLFTGERGELSWKPGVREAVFEEAESDEEKYDEKQGEYRCEKCGRFFPESEIDVDHKVSYKTQMTGLGREKVEDREGNFHMAVSWEKAQERYNAGPFQLMCSTCNRSKGGDKASDKAVTRPWKPGDPSVESDEGGD
jgi:5-methylcytosine-specific restriction endonuclease McrA